MYGHKATPTAQITIQQTLNMENIQGGQKKKRTGVFLQNSQNIGPMSLKINIHNLNTHSFQHLKYKIPNSKAS